MALDGYIYWYDRRLKILWLFPFSRGAVIYHLYRSNKLEYGKLNGICFECFQNRFLHCNVFYCLSNQNDIAKTHNVHSKNATTRQFLRSKLIQIVIVNNSNILDDVLSNLKFPINFFNLIQLIQPKKQQ